MKRTLMLAFTLLPALAAAQTPQPWDTNVLQWDAPLRCVDGSALSNCAITGYRIDRSPVAGGTATPVATVGNVLTFTHVNAPAGVNCYKVVALTAAGPSGPSNELCKTNTRPAVTSEPPRNLR